MKSEMNRWTDEEIFLGSEHVSSQIWYYLKLVRWRDEEWDEEMNRWKKIFLVQTCIKPNLVLSEISEMKSEMKRWKDEEKFFFLVWTCMKPNLVLSEISEIKRWRVRWRDENVFGSEHVSSQIWCYLKLVRWRVRWRERRDENVFWVRTCIKSNLVLSEISEMKSEMKRWWNFFFGLNMYQAKSGVIWNKWDEEMKSEMNRWTDEENFFGSEHVSSQIWCYLKLVRWRVRWRDEQMKKIFFGPNMYQAKSGVIWN